MSKDFKFRQSPTSRATETSARPDVLPRSGLNIIFWYFDPGPEESGGPPRAIRGPSRGRRRPPPGPHTNQSKKPRNLKRLIEQWRHCLIYSLNRECVFSPTKASRDLLLWPPHLRGFKLGCRSGYEALSRVCKWGYKGPKWI